MAVIGDLLFFKRGGPDLDDVLRHQAEVVLRQTVENIPEKEFTQHSDDELVGRVVSSATVKPLEVAFDQAKADVQETTVDVTGRFDYDMGDGRPVRAKGFRATKAIPFKGNPELWHLKTNPWGMNPPRGEVRGQTLVVGISVPEAEASRAKTYLDGVIAQLPEYLERQAAQIQKHNEQLPGLALPLIQQRRSRLSKRADLLKNLQG